MGFIATTYYLWGFINSILLFKILIERKNLNNLKLLNNVQYRYKVHEISFCYISTLIWSFLGLLTNNWLISLFVISVYLLCVRINKKLNKSNKTDNKFINIYVFIVQVFYFITTSVPVINAFHTKYNLSEFILGLFK